MWYTFVLLLFLAGTGTDAQIVKDRFIVLYKSQDAAVRGSAALSSFASKVGIGVTQQRTYKVFPFLGITFDKPPTRSQLETLRSDSAIEAVFSVKLRKLPKFVKRRSPQHVNSNELIGAGRVQASPLQLTGDRIKVGIIDTGIDYTHPDLGNCLKVGTDNCRVIAGYDFVGDAYDGVNAPVPKDDPKDCYGHGTHVAGIIGANGKSFKGVAPGVLLGAYKVFGCDGPTGDDIILEALDRAVQDGMQIINLSLGGPGEWPTGPEAIAMNKAVREHGIVIIASAGNADDANPGTFVINAPGSVEEVIAVASFRNTKMPMTVFTVIEPLSTPNKIPYIASYSPPFKTEVSLVLARTGSAQSLTDACQPLQPGSLTGRVALIRRAKAPCTPFKQVGNAAKANATGVLIYNNENGFFYAESVKKFPIPVASINAEDGERFDGLLAADPPSGTRVVIRFPKTLEFVDVPVDNAGKISDWSIRGPTFEGVLKPDIGAPGEFIISTWPIYNESDYKPGYEVLSGTSMAAPHVAGSAALLMQSNPSLQANSRLLRDILLNTAKPQLDAGMHKTVATGVQSQGAGLLDVYAAVVTSSITITPAKISLLDLTKPKTFVLRLINQSKQTIVFTADHVPGLTEGLYGKNFYPNSVAKVEILPIGVLSIPSAAATTIKVTVTPPVGLPPLPPGTVYSGYIRFRNNPGGLQNGLQYNVPYLGIAGDYQAIKVVDRTSLRLVCCPATTQASCNASLPAVTTNATVYVSKHFLNVELRFLFAADQVKLEVFRIELTGDLSVGSNTVVRDQLGEFIFGDLVWLDVQEILKSVVRKSGQHYVQLSVLKPLGNWTNKQEIYTWKSVVFGLQP